MGTDADNRGGDGDAEMGFSGAGAADEDGVALGIQEGAGCQLANLSLVHRRIGKEEAVEIFQYRELGAGDPVTDRSGLPMGALGADQAGDEGVDIIAPGQSLAGDLVEAGAHAMQLEFGPHTPLGRPESHGVPSGDLLRLS